MKKKVMVGLVSVVVAVALVFGGVTFYNNRQQEKFEKQMASYESVDTMQHPSEATTSIDGIQVPLGKKPKVTTKKTTKKSTRIQKLKKKASRSKITTRRTTIKSVARDIGQHYGVVGVPFICKENDAHPPMAFP